MNVAVAALAGAVLLLAQLLRQRREVGGVVGQLLRLLSELAQLLAALARSVPQPDICRFFRCCSVVFG